MPPRIPYLQTPDIDPASRYAFAEAITLSFLKLLVVTDTHCSHFVEKKAREIMHGCVEFPMIGEHVLLGNTLYYELSWAWREAFVPAPIHTVAWRIDGDKPVHMTLPR